ncbi:MAG TPA: hypothetical protein VEU33_02715 [Archangium sp.]|nr:hypothetical protein [Archangium sp.]
MGPVSVSDGRTDTLTNYQLRTATFDLSNPQGQADLNISQRFDKDGKLVPGSESYTYEFDTDDPNMWEIMVYAYTGDEAQAKAARDSDEPMTLTLTRDQMRQLQERASDQPMGHMGLGGLLSDYDGNPLDPTTAASILAGSPVYNEFRVVQELFGLSDGGNNPPPGTLQVGN